MGLRTRRQCDQIAKYLQSWQQENKQVTLCVEGNISAGKSTFLNVIRKTLCELKRDVEVRPDQQYSAAHGDAYRLAPCLASSSSAWLLCREPAVTLRLALMFYGSEQFVGGKQMAAT